VTPDDWADMLRKIDGALDDDERKRLWDGLSNAATAVRKAMTHEYGAGGETPAEGTAAAEVEKRVAEIRKKKPRLSPEAARGQVYRDDPALLDRVLREQEAARGANHTTED